MPPPSFDSSPDSANTAKLAVSAESGGATIDASESFDDAVAPPDSANTAKLAVSAESGGADDDIYQSVARERSRRVSERREYHIISYTHVRFTCLN